MHFSCLTSEIEPGQKFLSAISLVRLAIWEKKLRPISPVTQAKWCHRAEEFMSHRHCACVIGEMPQGISPTTQAKSLCSQITSDLACVALTQAFRLCGSNHTGTMPVWFQSHRHNGQLLGHLPRKTGEMHSKDNYFCMSQLYKNSSLTLTRPFHFRSQNLLLSFCSTTPTQHTLSS